MVVGCHKALRGPIPYLEEIEAFGNRASSGIMEALIVPPTLGIHRSRLGPARSELPNQSTSD